MTKYLVVLEKSETGYSAFSPDVPGCITVGDSVETTISNMREAIELYIEEAIEQGYNVPVGKGLKHHIDNDLLNPANIEQEYYLTEIEMELPEPVFTSGL